MRRYTALTHVLCAHSELFREMKMLVDFQDKTTDISLLPNAKPGIYYCTPFVFSFDFPIHVFLYKNFLISCQLSRVLNQFKQALSILFLHLVSYVSFDRFKCTENTIESTQSIEKKIERFDSKNEKKDFNKSQ